MSTDEKRIALAEWMGWKWYRRPATGPWAKNPMRTLYHPQLVPETVAELKEADMTERQCNPVFIWREGNIPEITLDWLHECEKKLTNVQQDFYTSRLLDGKIPDDTKHACWLIAHATTEQRLSALVETLGLGKEK